MWVLGSFWVWVYSLGFTVYTWVLANIILILMFVSVCLALYDEPSGKDMASVMSMLLGFMALYMFYQENIVFIITLALLVYPLIMLMRKMCHGRTGVAVSFITLVYLLTWYAVYTLLLLPVFFILQCVRKPAALTFVPTLAGASWLQI